MIPYAISVIFFIQNLFSHSCFDGTLFYYWKQKNTFPNQHVLMKLTHFILKDILYQKIDWMRCSYLFQIKMKTWSQVINRGELHGVILIALLSSLCFGVKEMAVSFQSPENIQYYREGAVTEGSVLRKLFRPSLACICTKILAVPSIVILSTSRCSPGGQHWPNIKPTLCEGLVFAAIIVIFLVSCSSQYSQYIVVNKKLCWSPWCITSDKMLTQCWFNGGPAS